MSIPVGEEGFKRFGAVFGHYGYPLLKLSSDLHHSQPSLNIKRLKERKQQVWTSSWWISAPTEINSLCWFSACFMLRKKKDKRLAWVRAAVGTITCVTTSCVMPVVSVLVPPSSIPTPLSRVTTVNKSSPTRRGALVSAMRFPPCSWKFALLQAAAASVGMRRDDAMNTREWQSAALFSAEPVWSAVEKLGCY